MRFSIAPSSIDNKIGTSRIFTDLLKLVSNFGKLLSPRIEPILFVIFAINLEPIRYCVTYKREG